MRRAGLVANRRDGKFVYYRLADDAVLELLAALRRIAERNVAEVERVVRSYFDERDSLEAGLAQRAGGAIASRHGHDPRRAAGGRICAWDTCPAH